MFYSLQYPKKRKTKRNKNINKISAIKTLIRAFQKMNNPKKQKLTLNSKRIKINKILKKRI